MSSLFDKITKVRLLDDDVFRNIVSLRESENLFDDLLDDDDDLGIHDVLVNFEIEHKESFCPATIKDRSFYYTTAVEYPFNTDNYMHSRYSDATFPAWYGSFDLDTTIYETLHWMIGEGEAIEADWDSEGVILHRERAIYLVHLDCMAYDLTGLENEISELIHPSDYSMTQMIGKRLYNEGARGLIAPSARSPSKAPNAVIFDIDALSRQPKLIHYLTYQVDFKNRVATVYRDPNEVYLSLEF